MMTRTTIDLQNYPRKAHFEYFRSLPDPYLGVTVNVDVTRLVSYCKERSYSFYLVLIRAATIAANQVPELRRRIVDGGIVEYDQCNHCHIELLDDDTYCYCPMIHDPEQSMEDYIRYAEQARKASREHASIDETDDVLSQYFFSSIPWLHYTQLRQPTVGGDDCNPRISWGKYEEDFKGRLMLPVTVLVHHALVDGMHLARFYENLERVLVEMTKTEEQ